MPTYRVELRRTIQRVVEMCQDASLYIEAEDESQARCAAYAISDQVEEEGGWVTDELSRQASNDEEVSRPQVQRTSVVNMRARFKASKILGTD